MPNAARCGGVTEQGTSCSSNREIAQMVFLSHRTVSSHLYRVFPKLGITSRTELRAVLDAGSPDLPQARQPLTA